MSSLAERLSLGDWLTCLLLLSVGLYLDRQPPFEQYIGNRLTDPAISYPHTPPERQQVTATQLIYICLLYTSPSPRDRQKSRMPSSA